jgi:hypothetical protein
MLTRILSILGAALILSTVSVASAATVHRQVRHYHYHYHHQPVIMLLENNPTGIAASRNEANTEAAIRFQEQFDNSY